MPKEALLAVLVAIGSLVLVLSMAAPAFAQEEPPPAGLQPQPAPEGQDDTIGANLTTTPASEVDCSQQAAPQVAPQEEMTELPAAANPESLTSGPEGEDVADESFTITDSGDNGNMCTGFTGTAQNSDSNLDPACAQCGMHVAKAAQEAITGDDTGPSATETFGVALQAARDAGSSATREAAASEEAQQDSPPVEDSKAAAYQAAFEAAKEAGADDETAKEAAREVVTEASKTRKGGSPSEGIAATEDKTRKEQTSKEATAQGKDRKDDKSRKDKTREETATNNASEEETTEDTDEDTDEEVAASGENDDSLGSGGEDVTSSAAPAGSRAPLLLGGVALLSVGGYAALRSVRSWPSRSRSLEGRRLLGN